VYSIETSKEAARALGRMPSDLRTLVLAKVQAVAADPHGRHANVKRLQGRPEFRLRVHDWRVLYRLVEDRLVLLVVKVGPRGEVYE
jgi:mRNA interferase RelE/StbE